MRYGILAVAAAALMAGGVHAAPKSNVAPPADQALARDILSELISINTVDQVTPAAAAMRDRLLKAGFSEGDLQLVAPPNAPEQANLVIRYHGKGKGRPVLFICHLDVVQALPEDWTVPPFQLTEKDGWFYGRGTSDIKGDDAALVESLIRLKREGFVPDRDIIVALTADEEDGHNNGPDFLLQHHRDLIDADLVINPDGGGGAIKNGKKLYYGIQTSEKTFVTFQLETTNKGGHSSLPDPDNAIDRLAAALLKLQAYKFPVHITETQRAWFGKMAQFETGQTREDMLALAKTPPDPAAIERYGSTPFGNAALRTTCVVTQIKGGHAENALPQRADASFQCRMIPGETAEEVQRQIEQVMADPQVKISFITPAAPGPESPPIPAVFDKLDEVIGGMWPGVPAVPVMDFGASDSKYTRAAGMPTYAMSSIFGDVDDVRAHGRDERIGVAEFYQGVEFTYRVMKRMSRAD
jgi:acetylornithine deacetylase/succinyl-diaminopimelate desuccinylase-like protein